jgi:hypothetical protein
MARLAPAAPVPPLALLGGKKRIAGLGYGSGKDVLAADIDALAGGTAEFLVEPGRVLPSKLFHAADAKKLKIAQHGRPNGDQILQMTLLYWHKKLPLTSARPMS